MERKFTSVRFGAIALTVTLLALASAQSASAITVAWGPVTPINSNDDIINPGNVIRAVNFTTPTDTSPINVSVGVHTVAFTTIGVTGGTGFNNSTFFVDDNPAPGAVGADFESVLDSFRDNGDGTVTIGGLVAGNTYFLQVFHSDDRGNRTVTWNINGTGLTYLDDTTTFRSTFSVATVTLGAGETSLTLTRTAGQINAAVLTEVLIAVPEPATASLGLLALGALAARRRRRLVA
ncbi:MAG: PEP-CTERM sorting domain-containing protein [Phycisphaeraceae bacterium]